VAVLSDPASALLSYWREGEWRCQFNHLPIAPSDCAHLQFVTGDKIALGKLESQQSPEGNIWIAPFVFENAKQQKWIPLWLPAECHKGTLSLRQHPTFPWIPQSQFVGAALHDFNEWCLSEFFTEERMCAFETWGGFYEASRLLVDSLSEGQWQSQLESKGYRLLDAAAYFGLTSEKNDLSPVLSRFMQIEEASPSLVVEDEWIKERAHLFCGKTEHCPPLSKNEYEIVIQALGLSKGDLLAIETPSGCNKESVIDAIVSSKSVYAAVHEQPLPVIYRLMPDGSLLENKVIPHQEIKDSINTLYQDMVSGLNLAEQLWAARERELAIDDQIADLQAQDEKAENQLDAVLLEQQKARKARKSLRQRWAEWFGISQCPLSNAIRQIKVQRTKIHQQLVDAVEQKAAYRQAEQYWKEWCQSHHITLSPSLDYSQSIREAQQNMACRMSMNQGWQHVSKISEKADLIIFDNAHQLYPPQVMSYLQTSHQAIFLGNPHEYRFEQIMDAITEGQILANYPILDEERLDELQYKGMLLSTGSAMTVALANSSIQSYTEYGEWRANCILYEIEPRHRDLVTFCNQFHGAKLISTYLGSQTEWDGLHFLASHGQSHPQGHERVNPIEARAIQEWLEKGYALSQSPSVVVVALYQSQVELIKPIIENAFSTVEIYTLDTLPNRNWDYIVFSSVVTANDHRPYLFDLNDTFFYSLVARARRGVWVVGDERVFNATMHSPSGKLAKYIFVNNQRCFQSKLALL
jgi:hypothetical protein